MSGWEIPRVSWRLSKSSRVLVGSKTSNQQELQKMMVEAGGRDGTADEALDAFYSYINRKQCVLLTEAIDERTPVVVEMSIIQEV